MTATNNMAYKLKIDVISKILLLSEIKSSKMNVKYQKYVRPLLFHW